MSTCACACAVIPPSRGHVEGETTHVSWPLRDVILGRESRLWTQTAGGLWTQLGSVGGRKRESCVWGDGGGTEGLGLVGGLCSGVRVVWHHGDFPFSLDEFQVILPQPHSVYVPLLLLKKYPCRSWPFRVRCRGLVH